MLDDVPGFEPENTGTENVPTSPETINENVVEGGEQFNEGVSNIPTQEEENNTIGLDTQEQSTEVEG